MSTFKNKNSLRTIEAQIVQKLNEVRPKLTGSYKKKAFRTQNIRIKFSSNTFGGCVTNYKNKRYGPDWYQFKRIVALLLRRTGFWERKHGVQRKSTKKVCTKSNSNTL